MKESTEVKPRILVVDDSTDNLKIIARALAPYYQVQIATSGHAALELLVRPDRADLVLLDVCMPEMNGFDVCRHIREFADANTLPVIFLTADEDSDHIVAGFDSGGNDYVIKPFVPVVLQARIRIQLHLQAINRRQQKLYEKMRRMNDQLRLMSNTDGLLGIANRRYFDSTLQKEWRRATRSLQHLSLLIIDVDCFKSYNDTYGHLAGDDCLKLVARVVSRTVGRETDIVARYGGEEIAVVLPDTQPEGAKTVAEAIREAVQAEEIPHETSSADRFVTVSIGVAGMVPQNNDNAGILITSADNALYKAKAGGRNRVFCA